VAFDFDSAMDQLQLLMTRENPEFQELFGTVSAEEILAGDVAVMKVDVEAAEEDEDSTTVPGGENHLLPPPLAADVADANIADG
jgi:PAS domain-containing protein